jgi:hypothetical protein
MTKLAIVKSTKSYHTDLVLRGVYGTMRSIPPLTPDAPEQRKFVVATEFRPVSKVFEDLDSILVNIPGEQAEYLEIDLSDEEAQHVKNALMLQLGMRHAHLYSRNAGQVQGLAAAIFEAEKRRAKSGVDQFFFRQNMTAWTVPVKSTVRSGLDGAYYQTKEDLFGVLRNCIPVTAVVDETRAPSPYDPAQENNVIVSVNGANEINEVHEAATEASPLWHDYSGVEADLQGSLVVMASSAEHASKVAATVLAVQDRVSEAARAAGDGCDLMIANLKMPTGIIDLRPLSPIDAVNHEADTVVGSLDDENEGGDEDDQPRLGHGYY